MNAQASYPGLTGVDGLTRPRRPAPAKDHGGRRACTNGRKEFKHSPVNALTSSGNDAVRYSAMRDLFGEDPGPVDAVWRLPEVAKMLRRQREDGSWGPPKEKGVYPPATRG